MSGLSINIKSQDIMIISMIRLNTVSALRFTVSALRLGMGLGRLINDLTITHNINTNS